MKWRLKMEIVTPKAFEGMNISWNLNLFSLPKFRIKCGKCGSIFSSRINIQGLARCLYCGTANKLPLEQEEN